MNLDYDVYNLSGNNDNLFRGLAIHPFGGIFMGKSSFFYLFARHVGRQLHAETGLSVEGDSVSQRVFFQVFFVVDGPFGVAYGRVMAAYVPQFFSYVRSERSNQDDQRFEDGTLVAFQAAQFVYADHEGTDGGIVREMFDVERHLLDQFVE